MIRKIRFILNNETVESSLAPGTVVLDFLRRERRLTGTKEGCREGDCGACMVLLGELQSGKAGVFYTAVNSCLLPLGDVEGKHLVSIEGLNPAGKPDDAVDDLPLNPIQKQMVEQGAIQCGFCTPGFVVALTGYLLSHRRWTYDQAVDALAGNICRCTGYASIKRAVGELLEHLGRRLAERQIRSDSDYLKTLVVEGIVPEYFLEVPSRLSKLRSEREVAAASGPSTFVAGGTDLFVQKADELLEEDNLSFASGHDELKRIRIEKQRIVLGAGLCMDELGDLPILKEQLPYFEQALRLIASAPIRRRATLGGNIANASPIGDFTVILLALGAVLELREHGNGKAAREVRLEDFYKGYKDLDKKKGEIIDSIVLPLGAQGIFNFEKVSRRKHLDIASVNSAAWIRSSGEVIEQVRLSAGGVAPIPLFLARASTFLEGRRISEENLDGMLQIAQEEISPISDVRGSAEYKRLLLRQLLLAHFLKAFSNILDPEVWK